MDSYIGMIALFGFNFQPVGWAFCDGRLLQISQFDVLFSLLGTTYGGDGQTTFALPDLRGRLALGQGQGAGLSNYVEGQMGGTETVGLTTATMPAHNHPVLATPEQGNTSSPANAFLAVPSESDTEYKLVPSDGSKVTMNAGMVGLSGTGPQPFGIVQPVLGTNYCICLEGVYPSRP